MDISGRHVVLNAFRPGAEIYLPSQFAGRRDLIATLTDALHIEGMCPIIYGDRGLGKSSLATQIERIAVGDVELLENLRLSSSILRGNQCYVTFRISCTDEIENKNAILQRLINTAEGFQRVDQLPKMQQIGETVTNKIDLKFYENQVIETYKREGTLSSYTNLSIEEKLDACARYISEQQDRNVLCIIDELDRVSSTSGLASFIKSFSSDRLKFLLVGVGTSVSALLQDHGSLERILCPVEVKHMNTEELIQIITLTEYILKLFNIKIKFSDDAKKLLAYVSGGFPWFVHILGQQSLIEAYDAGELEISKDRVVSVIKNLPKNRFAQLFRDLYLKAVGDSRPREIILRLFAKWGTRDIPTSEIYPVAYKLGISNPSMYTKELQLKKYGHILERVPYRETGGIYSFRNSMFRRYIELRNSVYSGVKEYVNHAWAESRS